MADSHKIAEQIAQDRGLSCDEEHNLVADIAAALHAAYQAGRVESRETLKHIRGYLKCWGPQNLAQAVDHELAMQAVDSLLSARAEEHKADG
jgi:hypothetical protein